MMACCLHQLFSFFSSCSVIDVDIMWLLLFILFLFQTLESNFANHHLERALNSHWAEYVPVVYRAKVDADTANEEKKVNKYLLRPLEQFMCNGNPDFVFKQLKEYDKPPLLCGRSFKLGEPTYSCRSVSCTLYLLDPLCDVCLFHLSVVIIITIVLEYYM
jgi:hypothetical protein